MSRPAFLPAGWPDRTGWRLPVRPEHVDGPWGRFLEVVGRAQIGDFAGDEVMELALVHEDELDEVGVLAGAIASHDQLRRVFPLIGTKRSFFASIIANESHWLDFAEACIENRFDTELRPLFFSEFLERWDTPDRESLEYGGRGEYLDRVRARIAELRARYPGVAHFAYGMPLHPRTYVDHIRSFDVTTDEDLWEYAASISSALFRLETLTGVRIPAVVTPNEAWGRVISNEPVPGSALRTIQMDPAGNLEIDRGAFLAALAAIGEIDLDAYEPGVRYFHGHRVG